MSNGIKSFYWVTFILSVVILPMNFGLGLIAMAIVIIPIIVMHFIVGRSLHLLEMHKTSVLLSASNFLLFVLIRPDGVHTIQDNGLSSLLGLMGIHYGYSEAYEDEFFIASLVLPLVQLVMEIRLMLLRPRTRKQSDLKEAEQD